MRIGNKESALYPWGSILLLCNFDARYLINSTNGDLLLKGGWDEDWLNCYCYLWLNPLIISFLYCSIIVIVDRLWTTKPFLLVFGLSIFVELKYSLLANLVLIENEHYWLRNQLLSNHLNRYHPAFFFFTVWGIFGFYFGFRLSIVCRKWNWRGFSSYQHYRNMRRQWGFISWMLLLGGWWAYQEGNWGGWWNWDPSEFLALAFGIHIALILHESRNLLPSFITFVQVQELFRFIFVLFVFIQLNFELTSHNFGLRSLPIFDADLNFRNLIVIIGFIQTNHLLSTYLFLPLSCLLRVRTKLREQISLSKTYLWWIVFAIGASYVHFSCNFIVNYFFWFSWGINFPFVIQTISSLNLLMSLMLGFLLMRVAEGRYVNVLMFEGGGFQVFLMNIYRRLTFGMVSHCLILLVIIVSLDIFTEARSHFSNENLWMSPKGGNFEIGESFADNATNGPIRYAIDFVNGHSYGSYQQRSRYLQLKMAELSAQENDNFRNLSIAHFFFDNISSLVLLSWVMIALLIFIF